MDGHVLLRDSSVTWSVTWFAMKGRVRIRKSKSGEKWNKQFVNNAYGVLLYRCFTIKIMFMQMFDSASLVCTEAWKMGILRIFAEIDAF